MLMVDNPNLADHDGHSRRQIYGKIQVTLYKTDIRIIDNIIEYVIITPGAIVVLGALIPYLI